MNQFLLNIGKIQSLYYALCALAEEIEARACAAAQSITVEYADHLGTLRLVVDRQAWVYLEAGSNTVTVDRIIITNGKRQGLRIAENLDRPTAVNLLVNMLLLEDYTSNAVITTFENNDPETAEFIRQLLESQTAKNFPV